MKTQLVAMESGVRGSQEGEGRGDSLLVCHVAQEDSLEEVISKLGFAG